MAGSSRCAKDLQTALAEMAFAGDKHVPIRGFTMSGWSSKRLHESGDARVENRRDTLGIPTIRPLGLATASGRMTKKKKRAQLEKLHETEDEKPARRLAKKAAKAESSGTPLGGYSNESNPWNDASLTDQFVWSKKVDKDRTMGIV